MKATHLKLFLAPTLLALVTLFIAIMQAPVLATGTTYYVDAVNGDDDNPGTSPGVGNAWKTISYAVANVPAGSNPGSPNIISVAAGTYDSSTNGESFPILLDRANLTLVGAGVGTSVIDGQTTTDTLKIDATGITVQEFTIKNAGNNGILATVGGFTVTHNSFISVTQGVNLDITANPTGNYTITDIVIFSNTFDLAQVSNGTGVRLYATLDFSAINGATAAIGDIDVSHNLITLSTASGTGIDLNYLDMNHLSSGQISLGDVTIEANTVISGRYGILYDNSISYITDTVVAVGQTSFSHNILQNQSFAGIDGSSYGNRYWYGASSGVYGNLSINFNNITSNAAGSVAIDRFWGYTYWEDLYGTSTITAGDFSLNNNTIEVNGVGISVYYYSLSYLYNDASVIIGDISVQNTNVKVNGSNRDGIYVYYEGYDLHNNAAYQAGEINLGNNTVKATGRAIVLDNDGVGEEYYDDAVATQGDTTIENNTLDAAAEGIYIHYYEMGYGEYGNAAVSVGNLSVTNNTITGTKGIYLFHDAVGYEMADNAKANLGKTRIADNTLTATSAAGIHIRQGGVGYRITDTNRLTIDGYDIINNKISGPSYGIFIDHSRFAIRMQGSAAVTQTEMIIQDNTVETSSSTDAAIYIFLDRVANDVTGSAQVTIGDITVDANELIGGSDSVEIKYGAANQTISDTATINFPAYHLVNNVMARGVDSGLLVNGNAPVNLIHNTIVSPTLGSGVGIHVVTGTVQLTNTIVATFTTGISQTGGVVSEDYTLFAGTTSDTSGTVITGPHSISNGNPAFTNPANNDYTLLATSDAIDNGVSAGIVVDKNNKPRYILGGYDMGAYEFGWLTYLPMISKNE